MITTTLQLLKSAIVFSVKWYIILAALVVIIGFALKFLLSLTKPRSALNYYLKFALMCHIFMFTTPFFIPTYLFRLFNVANVGFTVSFLRKTAYLVDVSHEYRGIENIIPDSGGMVCVNHQSVLDLLTMTNDMEFIPNSTMIAKKEVFYAVPFGPAIYLGGAVSIDRKSASSAVQTLDRCSEMASKKKVKFYIYPEGTRNSKRGMLPFKKGAFATAIKAQVPIIPMVHSPYYFLDQKKRIFDKAHIIVSVLEPIPTVGMTMDDLTALTERTRNVMMVEYEKLCVEVDENSEKWKTMDFPRATVVGGKGKRTKGM